MMPRAAYSNCVLAVLWLWLAGRADFIIAMRSDIGWYWPWHLGTMRRRNSDLVYHFKRTRLVRRQPFAPFWFEGRMLTTPWFTVQRSLNFLWIKPAWQVVPWLMALVAVGLPVWMAVSALYWPVWLASGAWEAIGKRGP